ncbi:extracellular solute-binding protein [Paenibacillus hodogayensis]|uniref:Extracellular solute-binding protein n=1 Tax=Paenibacillus hodogayensis TaxID=279208 RepID=A0ABV5VVC5_9BACL
MKAKPTSEQFRLELERMADELRADIENGIYPAGSYLPSEPQLAKRFRLSNKSVRKGMEKLVEDGLIEKIPRVGNRVAAQRPRVRLTLACTYSIERDFSLSRLLDDFHRQHPWVRVEVISYNELSSFYDDGERRQADVFAIDSTQFQELREDGRATMLEPLDGAPEAFPFLNEAFRADGVQYVLPAIFTPIVLCYNRSHFRECRLPEPHGGWTWDDLARNAAVLSSGGNRLGFCFHLLSENRWPLFLLQSGGRFEWEDGRLGELRGTALLEGMRLGKRIIRDRDIFPFYLSENNDEINALFLEGKVSMILTSYMGMNEFRGAGLEYDISPVPNMGEPRTLAMAIGFGVSRDSGHKEAARILAEYFGTERAQTLIRTYTLSVPALQQIGEASNPTSMNVPARYGLYREIVASYRLHSELNVPWRMNRVLAGQLKSYWAGLLDDDELCDKLAEKLSVREPETAKR